MTTKNYFQQTAILVFSLFLFGQVQAQLSFGGEPYNWRETQLDESIPFVTTEELDYELISAQDAINDREKALPYRFGIERDVHYTPENSGRWMSDDEGNLIWQLGIHCPDAKSINLGFDEYYMPKGGKLYVWSADRQQYLGGFDHRNNDESGEFAIGIIHSEEIVIECIIPAEKKSELKLSLGTIVHGYRWVLKNEFTEDQINDRGPFGSSGSCNNNVICPVGADWQVEKRSVVLILLSNSLCSGALVNNTSNDGTPYILTANHCTPGSNNVSNWVFYFNHDAATCNGNTGPTNMSISGATFRAKNAGSDFALVQMSSIPPSGWNVQYAGWDATDQSNISHTVGIHHPAGDVKKISFDNDPPVKENDNTAVWYLENWEDGITEGGSSGSPLFDPEHRIIGQLYAGTSACMGSMENDGYDIYGRFGVSWNSGATQSSRLKEWLDPGNTGTLVMDGYPDGATQYALDAGVVTINGISSVVCEPVIEPKVVLRNNGSQTLTSCKINYQLNGGSTQVYNWTGSLAQGLTTNVTLPTITLTETSNTLTVTVSNPNGSTDQNSNNNTASISFNAVPGDSHTVTMTLHFDSYPAETAWTLRNAANNQIIYTSGGYAYDNSGYANFTIQEEFCLPDGCYIFTINDSWGDGICCNFGSGSYNLKDENGATIVSGGNFTNSETTNFCLTSSGNAIDEQAAVRFTLHPNPASEKVTITHSEVMQRIQIRDITGKLIASITPNSTLFELDCSDLANGLYICEVSSAKETSTEKLLIRH